MAGRRRPLSGRGGRLSRLRLPALATAALVAAVLCLHAYWGLRLRADLGRADPAVPLPSFQELRQPPPGRDDAGDGARTRPAGADDDARTRPAGADGRRRLRGIEGVHLLRKIGVRRLVWPGRRSLCRSSDFVFLVASPGGREQRNAVRDTWAEGRALFFTSASGNGSRLRRLRREASEHNDLLVLQLNSTGSWGRVSGLLLAARLLFDLAETCANATFFVRTNDRAFWNVGRLRAFLKDNAAELADGKWTAGRQLRPDWVHRDPRDPLYTSKLAFGDRMFPASLLEDPGYAVSRAALVSMLALAHSTPLVFVSDMYITGLLRSLAGAVLLPVGDIKRSRAEPISPCYYRMFVAVPAVGAAEMRSLWPRFTDPKHKCSYTVVGDESDF